MNSQTISVISEYKKIGLDFEQLLVDKELLEKSLSEAEVVEKEKQKELEATQFCFNLNPNSEYKKFLDDVSIQFLKARYKVRMLKLIQLLSQKYDSIDKCVEKREKLLDIIKFRKKVVQELFGLRILFDPFDRVKIREQLEVISPFVDNSRTISKIRKEIGDLTSRTEEMMRENSNYLITLGNTKELIESKVSFSDIDISPIVDDFEEELMVKKVEPNQVVSVRAISDKLNMSIVMQKANGVIGRVNKLMNRSVFKKEENSSSSTLVPDLVIVPTTSELNAPVFDDVMDIESEIGGEIDFDTPLDLFGSLDVKEDDMEIEPLVIPEVQKSPVEEIDSDLFETVSPFVEPIMFSDRSDDAELSESSNVINFPMLEKDDLDIDLFPALEDNNISQISEEEESDEFWPSQTYSDEQIGKILSLNNRKAA